RVCSRKVRMERICSLSSTQRMVFFGRMASRFCRSTSRHRFSAGLAPLAAEAPLVCVGWLAAQGEAVVICRPATGTSGVAQRFLICERVVGSARVRQLMLCHPNRKSLTDSSGCRGFGERLLPGRLPRGRSRIWVAVACGEDRGETLA